MFPCILMMDAKLVKVETFGNILYKSLACGATLPTEFKWLLKLIRHQNRRLEEFRLLLDLIAQTNTGVSLAEILDRVYESFRPFIPFDRIGLALLESSGAVLRAHWGRSEAAHICLKPSFSAPMEGSSLQSIIE